MNLHFFTLLLSLTAFTLSIPATSAWWDEDCADGGQCANMMKNYESLIQGDGCTSFYYTGKCNRICTYSLKSLIGRQTWSRCAKRCDWSTALTEGAQSWLTMCLARPAPDILPKDESDLSTDGKESDQSANVSFQQTTSVTRPKRIPRITPIWIASLCVVLVGVVLLRKPALRTWSRYTARRLKGIFKRTFVGKAVSGKAPLDVGPDRKELRMLQRGARRHLKALQSNLD